MIGHKTGIILLACVVATSSAIAQTSREAPLSPEAERAQISRSDLSRRVSFAISKGVKYLLSRQNTDGSWGQGDPSDNEGGNTALVTLALLSSGESHQSPALTKAIRYLKRIHPENVRHATYSIALRACVYSMLPEALRKEELKADLRWLQHDMIENGDRRGMYSYGGMVGFGGDYSNSQYGVLGVWYAAQAGLEVPIDYWKKVEDGWLIGRNDDGGWGYTPDRKMSYGSMTAAAIATLFITNDYLHIKETNNLNQTSSNKPLDGALEWLANNFAVDRNPGHEDNGRRGRPMDRDLLDLLGEMGRSPGFYIHYMLFGYERAGEASGYTRFGTHKWYDEGADYLFRTQAYDGSWDGQMSHPETDTAYSLLFLSRGRAPVVAQKLQFEGRWNNRPRDAAAFTRFMRRATERHVNWQIVSIDDSPAELRESPLLYVASNRELDWSDAQKAKIKAYIDQGGLLVCVNEGSTDEMAKSVIKLGEQLYPAYHFRDLPQDHPAYSANFPANYGMEPLKGLSNGVRELIVLYSIGDMSWKWQSTGGAFAPRNTPYATLANLWLYATDRANPRFKGEDTWIDRNDAVAVDRTVRVFRVSHAANWDPEPGGWQRLANVMHNFDQVDLDLSAPKATTQASDLPDAKRHVLAHLTATRSVQLTPTMKAALKRYIDGGGMLLLDAASGSSEAAGSFDPLVRELYPSVVIAPLPLDHPIYRAAPFGGQQIERVTYRRSQDLTPVTIPRLRGAMVGNKLVAIISHEDMSGGLVAYTTAGLVGYSPNSATDLMRNIILWRASALK
ncbi:MAG TPA: DUF4159 domain-containing protein [Tepidisphaeraceae bacterium]|nr:DUF4159 domain-containing protein [Tepidisphaeraceae bacterium]